MLFNLKDILWSILINVQFMVYTQYVGGLDQRHLSPVDYRIEPREAKARVDLPFYRAVLDEFGFTRELLLHALESNLIESGACSHC